MKPEKNDLIGNLIIIIFLSLLFVAGIISYKSIDWTVLKRLESTPLNLPPQASASATTQATSSATTTKK